MIVTTSTQERMFGARILSIVIPAHNCEAYVDEAIASARHQSLADIEIIVIDDGSQDGTWNAIGRHRTDRRVVAVRQKNAGVSAARNRGIAIARGRYVGFLDADDRWMSEKAERHLAELEDQPGLDCTFSMWRIIDASGTPTGRIGGAASKRVRFEDLLKENVTGTASTLVCRRSALTSVGGFDAHLRSNVDLDLMLRIALLRGTNVGGIGEVLTEYRRRPGQITGDWKRMLDGWETVLEKVRVLAPDRVGAVEDAAKAKQWRYGAFIAMERGEYSQARRLLAKAWAESPRTLAFDRRAWFTTIAGLATAFPRPMANGVWRLAERVRNARWQRGAARDR